MPTDLQDAIDFPDIRLEKESMFLLVPDFILDYLRDAARRGANPDLEAAASVLEGAYDVPPITAKIMARSIVNAALGITEDE